MHGMLGSAGAVALYTVHNTKKRVLSRVRNTKDAPIVRMVNSVFLSLIDDCIY